MRTAASLAILACGMAAAPWLRLGSSAEDAPAVAPVAGLIAGSLIAGVFSGNHAAQTNGAAQAESQVGGPVAIMEVLWHSGDLGLNFTLAFIAVISLTLALINILPLPALDGGRLLLSIISRRLMRRPLSQVAEERIVGTGMAVIFLLIILITIVDVKRSF